MSGEQIEIVAEEMVQKKGKVIRNAINHLIGKDLDLSEIVSRGALKLLPDGTEVFSFDGIDLIHFSTPETELIEKDNRIINKVTNSYRILYT